jgi:alginate O-acetyltransferase complex protein AlgI
VTFTSFKFLLIFPLIVGLYYAIPERCRVLFLLLTSYVFVALTSIRAAAALAAATIFTYVAAKYASGTTKKSHNVFVFTIGALTLYLIFFKITAALPLGRFAHLAAPLGLSYYTFKLMSYVIDVYWGKIEPTRDFTGFATAIAFFPQITAGPIQRPADFLSQLPTARTALWMGLSRIAWGMGKKLLIADNLAPTVGYVFSHTHTLHGPSLLAGFYLFPLQMYADFSALTDIALGLGLIFGIIGPENFNRPFTATSITDFWRRWHMSLTNWLADYVFTPLRMATRSAGSAGLALSITLNMLAVGLWHGFTFGYLIFGALNAAYLVGDVLTSRRRTTYFKAHPEHSIIGSYAGWLLTAHLFCLAMVFFRANHISDAFRLVAHLTSGFGTPASDLRTLAGATGTQALAIGLIGYAFLELAERYRPDIWWTRIESTTPPWIHWPVRFAIATCVLAAIFSATIRQVSHDSPFLYQVF